MHGISCLADELLASAALSDLRSWWWKNWNFFVSSPRCVC